MRRSSIAAAAAAVLLSAMATAFAADRASEKFIKEAIEGNLAEVQVGKLAQEKGQRADVKAFGQMLTSDHGSANQKAMQVAGQLGVTPPNEPNAKLSGDKFDAAFAKEMVKDHKDRYQGVREGREGHPGSGQELRQRDLADVAQAPRSGPSAGEGQVRGSVAVGLGSL